MSRVPEAIDGLIAVLTTPLASVALLVDGPIVTDDPLQKAVGIGWDGNEDGDYAATVDWGQTWAGLGAKRKDEKFGILGFVSVWNGDSTPASVKQRRDEAFALLQLVETTLITDPGLGRPQPFVAGFSSGQLFQEAGPYGRQARIAFVVEIDHARI